MPTIFQCLEFIYGLAIFLSHICTGARFVSESRINRIVLWNNSLIVGAVNNVSRHSLSDLSVIEYHPLGPIEDSPLCSSSGCLPGAKRHLSDYHVKLLQPLSDGLLVCGSLLQGVCQKLALPGLNAKEKSSVPVVANLESASTEWLMTPQGLVVAATPTEDNPYRDPFPAVAIRDAPHWHIKNAGSLEGEAAVFLRRDFRSSTDWSFVGIFSDNHFVFIAVVEHHRSEHRSKLIRFCANDSRLTSYSEIEIQCRSDQNVNFEQMTALEFQDSRLVATFYDQNHDKSAVCVYTTSLLKSTFWFNIDRCWSGTGTIQLPHIGRDQKCTNRSHLRLDDNSCQIGASGAIEAVQLSSFETSGKIHSLKALSKVVLVGLDDELLKLKWETETDLTKFDGNQFNGIGAISAILYHSGGLLLQGNYQITAAPLENCDRYLSCSECLQAADPLCSWCVARSACLSSSSCKSAQADICPMSEQPPNPSVFAVGSNATLQLKITNLAYPFGYTYECVFGTAEIRAIWQKDGLSCKVPSSLVTEDAKENMILAVRTSLSPRFIVEHEVTAVNCAAMRSCATCSQDLLCGWCNGVCQRKEICQNPTSNCVRISTDKAMTALPAGIPTTLKYSLIHAEGLSGNSTISCRLRQGKEELSFAANVQDNVVQCQNVLHPPLKEGNSTAVMEISESGSLLDAVSVTSYDCSLSANDCSTCTALPSSWRCGWCRSKCTFECHDVSPCDRPVIKGFYPRSAPAAGGTVITIEGTDLGSSMEDIVDRVWVGSSRCIVTDYEVSKKIVCVVEKGGTTGVVRVSVGRNAPRIAESTAAFSFVEVMIFSVYPLYAPISGGTTITAYGQNLDAGSTCSVTIGTVPCRITDRSSTQISCILESVNEPTRTRSISIKIDNEDIKLETSFDFRPDPKILKLYPEIAFRAGGRNIALEGTNFDSAISPMMRLVASTNSPLIPVSLPSKCIVANSTFMQCPSPQVTDMGASLKTRYFVAISADALAPLRINHRLQLRIVPNPELEPFSGIRTHQKGQPLILDGIHLNEAAEPSDYKIFIGKERCYVSIVDSKQLVCNPPMEQPAPTDENGTAVLGDLPLVTSMVGSLRAELGLIEYVVPMTPQRIWLIGAGVLGLLVLIGIILFVIWRHSRKEKDSEYRKIQMQLEELESNVRKECKQAFVELQNTLSLSTDASLCTVGCLLEIPEYTRRLLWQDAMPNSHPTLYASTPPLALAQFDSLLSQKSFIFALVEAVDSDVSTSPQEKNLVCSLLTSALSRNFHYLTEVVIDLLRAHISITVKEQGETMMFRKSESLVEKLVAKWFAISLHPYFVGTVSEPLMKLLKALKIQAERGPVDCVTGCARYTINESKLLRESVEFAQQDILVMDMQGRGPFLVHVNSCDSISQVKSKILDRTCTQLPHSLRPSLSQFEIEWHNSTRGRVILRESNSERVSIFDDWKIPSGALLLMTPTTSCDSVADSGCSSLERTSPTAQKYHLTPAAKRCEDTVPRSIPEIYLTRLLTSKSAVQQYVEAVLNAALMPDEVPPCVKYIFDLLDKEAAKCNVDSNISRQWKGNLYVLRVWATILHNPRIVFDVPPSPTVDADLRVVAQTMMDCFSAGEPLAASTVSSSRLLYAKEVSTYRPMVCDSLKRISKMAPVSDVDLADSLTVVTEELSNSSSTAALAELLNWVRGNGIRIAEIMAQNEECISARLPQRLSQVASVDADHIYCSISDYSS